MNIQVVLSLPSEIRQLRQRDHWTLQQLESYRVEALRRLREHTYTYSHFYQRFHQGLTNAPLPELPVLTKAMPPGVYGDKLLITVLFNRTQPLIRYELSDSVRLATNPCPSGHPFALIDDIQGRVEDVLSFPGAAGGVVNVHPLVFSRILDTIPVSGWQVVQEADVLHVLLSGVRGEFGDEMLADTLRQALAEQGAIIPRVEVQRVESIPKTAAGKSPLIKSNLSQAEISPSARTSELTR